MNEQLAIRKLTQCALSVLTEYINKFPTKNIRVPDIEFADMFNIGGEFDYCKNLIRLNRLNFEKFGYMEIRRIMLHELAHLLSIQIYNRYTHCHRFKSLNKEIGGIENDED